MNKFICWQESRAVRGEKSLPLVLIWEIQRDPTLLNSVPVPVDGDNPQSFSLLCFLTYVCLVPVAEYD